MDNYETKKVYLLLHQSRYTGASHICPSCGKPMKHNEMTLQHRLANSKKNRQTFPLFIDSILNLFVICHHCNVYANRGYGRLTMYQALKREQYLTRNERVAEWANNPTLKRRHYEMSSY